MVIDIISYTEEQLACLSAEQIMEVKSAQIKKNALLKQKEQVLEAERFRLQKNGVFRSGLYSKFRDAVDEEYDGKVTEVREALLFYLQYTSRPADGAEQDAPYIVNYALSLDQRLDIVRNYYNTTYTDPKAKFEAFQADTVAKVYLGEFYAPLYHVYMEEAK